ncbi:MAG: protein phosphatase 2C domain-containing protein [Hyphomonadaceae bacterium]
MLTFVEAISLAGDRGKQNDDACGFAGARAWVLDGATDLDDAPLTGAASDASWIAHFGNAYLHAASGDLRSQVSAASAAAGQAFAALTAGKPIERWQSPISSLLIAEECEGGVHGLDLGDSRVFARDANGVVHIAGGPDDAADDETALAAKQTDAHKPLLARTETIAMLRRSRAGLNQPGARWTFGVNPACADHAQAWRFELARPAHILLMTDGFSALTDRYRAYDAGGLVAAALASGLQELGREVRAIENADAGAHKHPRFKKSDDATALLMRLT